MTTKFRTKLETLQAVIQLSEEQAGLNLVNELLADAESLSLLLPREMRVLDLATELYPHDPLFSTENYVLAALNSFLKAAAFVNISKGWNYEDGTMKINLNKPPRPFQVEDTVFSLQYGFATIVSIEEGRSDMYAIRTYREGERYQPTFTPCGRYYDNSKYRIWFLKEEVEAIFQF